MPKGKKGKLRSFNNIRGGKRAEVEADDNELGFGLSYKSIENLGDILFEFPLVTEQIQYSLDNEILTYNLEAGFLKKYDSIDNYVYQNGWTTANRNSEQAAILQYIALGTANEIETTASSQSLTIGLPNDVTIGNNLTITTNGSTGGTFAGARNVLRNS